MKTVVMLLANPFRPDPRVQKEAVSLATAGYEVTIICWDREGQLAPEQMIEAGVRLLRVQNVRSAYGVGARQLTRLPLFWREAVRLCRQFRPDIIHCHDLDTLPAGWAARLFTRSKLIFDAHEDYPALMSLYLPGAFVALLRWLEVLLIHQVDGVITASSVLGDKYRAKGISPLITVGNYQDLAQFASFTPSAAQDERSRLGITLGSYVIAYIGGFTRNRLLIPLIEAASQAPGASFFLWGDGHQREAVAAAAALHPNVHYLGWLPSERVPITMKAADVIYYCLKPDYPGASFNASNTLTYAMAAGRPVIANRIGDLGRIVQETGCGLLIDEVSAEAIAAAVHQLSDPDLRASLGDAGSKAAQKKYNWSAASAELLTFYQTLAS